MVTAIDMRSELRLALAAKQIGNLNRRAAEGLSGSVDYIPFTLNFSSSFVRIKWRTGAAVEMSRAAA